MEPLPPLIAEKLPEVRALCEKYHVRKLSVFGSAVKGTFDPARSDVDFVVEFEEHADPLVMGRRYLQLLLELSNLFARRVDLLERGTIENPYFLRVLELTEQALYERTRAA